jgi:REP element-mobilizing transposase RayT
MARQRQQELRFRNWGGRRAGAGRPRGARVSHDVRPSTTRHTPIHVTLRFQDRVWNLRSQRCFRVVGAAIEGAAVRPGFRVVHFSVQGNHAHLLVEADSDAALSRGVQALTIRIAKGLNRLMGTRGPVLSDRYHAHVLRTPAEARHALCYVLQNFRRHAAQRGERIAARWLDPYSSAARFDGWASPAPPIRPAPPCSPASRAPPPGIVERLGLVVVPAESWLLRIGWRRRGLIATHEVPGTSAYAGGRTRSPEVSSPHAGAR